MYMKMHFAELDPNTKVVTRVIVADSRDWCETSLGGTWVRTYYSTPGKLYAGVGYEYIEEAQNFRPPQPFPSWSFDFSSWEWTPPIPYPDDDDDRPRKWHEEMQCWVL